MNEAVEIPADSLTEELLFRLIENFVLREGTDYGPIEVEHSVKIAQLKEQVLKKEVKIFFDLESESVNFLKADTFQDFLNKGANTPQ